jgi:hypothetical protein
MASDRLAANVTGKYRRLDDGRKRSRSGSIGFRD